MKDQGMTVTIYNDGDERWSSYEARLIFHKHNVVNSHDIQISGIGGSKEEAIHELKHAIRKLSESLEKVDFNDTLGVAWDNTPLDEHYKREKLRRQQTIADIEKESLESKGSLEITDFSD